MDIGVQLSGELSEAVEKNYSSSSNNINITSHTKNSKPLPSEIFKAVEDRIENDIHSNDDDDPIAARILIKQQKQRREEERQKLLDMRLEQLDQISKKMGKTGGKKSKTVSEQVKKMLIKSRATGNKKLRQEDRFYLQTVLLDETKINNESNNNNGVLSALEDESQNVQQFMSSSYTFYSRVSTIGKIISTASAGSSANSARDVGAELLILTSSQSNDDNDDGAMVYRRLPPTLRLHEAEAKGLVTNFGPVLIRIFKGETDCLASCYTESITI